MQSVEKSEVLQSAILRNFSYNMPGTEIFDRLHAIVDGASCHTLDYDSGEKAAKLLMDAFGGMKRRGAG